MYRRYGVARGVITSTLAKVGGGYTRFGLVDIFFLPKYLKHRVLLRFQNKPYFGKSTLKLSFTY